VFRIVIHLSKQHRAARSAAARTVTRPFYRLEHLVNIVKREILFREKGSDPFCASAFAGTPVPRALAQRFGIEIHVAKQRRGRAARTTRPRPGGRRA
jgi:hypothetical protein